MFHYLLEAQNLKWFSFRQTLSKLKELNICTLTEVEKHFV
jgi:hypothetical protein